MAHDDDDYGGCNFLDISIIGFQEIPHLICTFKYYINSLFSHSRQTHRKVL